ncbi:alpha/beta fold hydrolase [Nocardioides sp. Soil796]|uniref:alpha/beta fold hydrolase n=1 Tax=Nocardioides sp. Soil796 TaxID=1736412 RepID=UPI00070D804A|nr:alpha/beta hydrolase [Nocardioides sp. Soil796]KRF20353.1 bromoperoxidase [Nocardioides sp. Soil796]
MSTEDNEQSTDQGNLHVVDSGGDGRPVVLIHGWPLSGASWAEQLEPLRSAGYRVVTYDRRGFGESGPGDGYDYDRLAGDLDNVLKDLDLQDVTLVGFSMGGGEVARYVASHGEDRLHSVVFAAAVPPYLLKTDDNPDGPLTEEAAAEMRASLESSRDEFFPGFVDQFYSVDGELKVSDDQREQALALCAKSDQDAVLGCMDAFGGTDFREDLKKVTVPTLVIHGDKDAIVPFEGSGKRTHEAIENSELVLVEGGPHGLNVSHADEFNRSLLHFLEQ